MQKWRLRDSISLTAVYNEMTFLTRSQAYTFAQLFTRFSWIQITLSRSFFKTWSWFHSMVFILGLVTWVATNTNWGQRDPTCEEDSCGVCHTRVSFLRLASDWLWGKSVSRIGENGARAKVNQSCSEGCAFRGVRDRTERSEQSAPT